MTGYDVITNTVIQANQAVADQRKVLAALQSDPNFISLQAKINQTNAGGWIDSTGTAWYAPDAAAERNTAIQQVGVQNDLIKKAQQTLNDLIQAQKDAIAAQVDYEKNSPTVTQQMKDDAATAIANANAATASAASNATAAAATTLSKTKIALIIGGVVIFIVIVWGVVKYVTRNKNK